MSLNDPIGSQTPPPLPWQQPQGGGARPEAVLRQSTNFPGAGGPGMGGMGGGMQLGGVPKRTPIWLWVVTLGLLGVLVFFQRPEPENTKRAEQEAKGLGKITPPKASEFVLVGKFLIALKDFVPPARPGSTSGGGAPALPGEDPTMMMVQFADQFAGWNGTNKFQPASASNPPKPPKEGEFPGPAADRLRATIIAGETLGPDELLWRVLDIEKSLDEKSPLVEDVKVVRVLYGLGPALEYGQAVDPKEVDQKLIDQVNGRPDLEAEAKAEKDAKSDVAPVGLPEGHEAAATLTDAQKDGFKQRHGWFAELALSRGDTTSTLRETAARQGWMVLGVLIAVGMLVFLAVGAGFVLLIVFAVRLFGGSWKWRMERPRVEGEWPSEQGVEEHAQRTVGLATPGSVWLETVAVFFASFLGIKLIGMGLHKAGVGEDALVTFSLAAQWAIALSIFWPLVRGMSWGRWKREIGWHAPRGVLREVGAGFAGYIAGLPVYFAMAIVVVILTFIISAVTGSDPKPAGNRITDLLEGGALWQLIVIYLLATVWAPVVEESIFRGCLFRHLRRRTGVILAALGSALVFAVLHGYVIQGLIMVGTLGFWFALMREWRGSIVASMTAHAIHNGVVMAVMVIVMSIASA